MKVTKFGMVVAAFGLLCAYSVSGVQAQGTAVAPAPGTGVVPAPKHQGGKLRTFLKQLNLSPAQKKQIAAIAKGEKAQMTSIKQNTTLAPKAMKAEEKTAHKAATESIMAVLTPAQQTQLKQLVAQSNTAKPAAPATPGASTTTQPSPPPSSDDDE